MMKLLLPLGLLGLLGVLALIIIYIVRPNYETKHVNSTYVWQLSLNYRKKRLPASKLRNILLFVCQLLILTAMAMILAKPAVVYETVGDENELIAVIDSSMSMFTASEDGNTRFSRAIDKALEECTAVLGAGGKVSVILADDEPSYLYQRVSAEETAALADDLNKLRGDGSVNEVRCSYGTSDLDKAMELSEVVLAANPYARISVFTDKSYQYVPENINIVSVAGEGDWNVGILNASAELDDGFYQITVQIACYGDSREVDLNLLVYGANAIDADRGGTDLEPITETLFCDDGEVKTVIFRYEEGTDTDDIKYCPLTLNQRFYTFKSIELYVDENDSLKFDDGFYIYGGLKEVVRVQYASDGGIPADPSQDSVGANPFVNAVLPVMKEAFSSRWDIQITEVRQGDAPATEGFDVYIFEHSMPKELPKDGVVFLFDPLSAPVGSDITLQRDVKLSTRQKLAAETTDHPVMRNVMASNIEITRYQQLGHSGDSGYEVLMTCRGAPVLLVRNDQGVKTAVMAFSVHNANLVMLPEWVILMYNLFDYFLPSTVIGNNFEVNEKIEVNARGPRTTVSSEQGAIEPFELDEFPATLSFQIAGTYTFDVNTYFAKQAPTQKIYVQPPEEESNIFSVEDSLENPFTDRETIDIFDDLLIWFAAALVALLFVEWAVHSLEKS